MEYTTVCLAAAAFPLNNGPNKKIVVPISQLDTKIWENNNVFLQLLS